jgi:hypothetical protein
LEKQEAGRGGNMALKKSEFLGAWGKAFQIFKAIVDAILASGGSDEDVARLESLAPQIAALSIAARPPKPEDEVVEEVSSQPAVPTYPAIGEVFELTLDGDVPENQPLQIVKDCGYTGKWRHNGRTVKGKQTRRFKFAQAGYQPNLDGVKAALPTSGSVEGQWIKAFKAAYPQPDGNGPIGIADASWILPLGVAYFPVVYTDGYLGFGWADNDRDARWRWLVPAE